MNIHIIKSKLSELYQKVISKLNIIADFFDKASAIRIWVRLNQSATLLVLIVAVVAFKLSYKKYMEDQIKINEDRITKAWDVVTKMTGKESNGGQINSIQILVKNSIPLDHIDLHNTWLQGANLSGASLRGADLRNSNLTEANLQGADLSGAKLDGAKLYHANLSGVKFDRATLNQTKLSFAVVDISIILANNLNNTDLTGVFFVMTDDNGNVDWGMYGDTIAESSDADDAQRKIDGACIDNKYNVAQYKYLPIKLPKRKCGGSIEYSRISNKFYE